MLASELEAKLKELREKHGDLPVRSVDNGERGDGFEAVNIATADDRQFITLDSWSPYDQR